MSTIKYRYVEFKEQLTQYQGLKIFRPVLLSGPGEGWYYLGPAAISQEETASGLIVKAIEPSALDDVLDWEPVFIDIEGRQFSTWRGIARDNYVVVGHFFVTGTEKPTKEQTIGIKAIRKDLIAEREPHNLIWREQLPKAILTLWDVKVAVLIEIPTGAFVSAPSDTSVGLQIGLVRFNVAAKETE